MEHAAHSSSEGLESQSLPQKRPVGGWRAVRYILGMFMVLGFLSMWWIRPVPMCFDSCSFFVQRERDFREVGFHELDCESGGVSAHKVQLGQCGFS